MGKYSHQLSDPRLLSLLNQQNPIWHTVSVDLLGPYILKQFRGARGKLSTYKAWGLFFCDLASGLCDIQMMDGSSAENCTRCITTFSNKHRVPSKIVMDSGPQLKTLATNPVFMAASDLGVKIEPVAAYHQFLNFCERTIQVYKNLMGTMKRSIDRSIYNQSDTLIDLLEKLAMVDRVMSLRPILTKVKDSEETVVLACQFAKPSLGSKDVEDAWYLARQRICARRAVRQHLRL